MLSLTSLFEETKHKGRGNKYIKDLSMLPELTCPDVGSIVHNRDVEIIKHYFDNKSLSDDFLKLSHDSCKKIFKKFCKQNNYKVDWKLIEDGLKDTHAIIFSLKNKFKRPRPKELLKLENTEYDNIADMTSYSFPSGHTTSAYFVATVLSDVLPEETNNFKTMAELIGHSRIENCVHYPSDILYGQLMGELLGQLFLNEVNEKKHNITKLKLKRKDEKLLAKHLRLKAKNTYEYDANKNFCHDMTEFIVNSCKIENIDISYDNCYESCYDFLSGYPIKNIQNDHVRSHIKMMCMASKQEELNNVFSMINLHRQLDEKVVTRGKPGMIRYFDRTAPYGNRYSQPKNIIFHLQALNKIKNPFIRHILYEWIHPFCDGNGRTGRVKLLFDLDFEFSAVNQFCGRKYLENIHAFVDKHVDINNILN
jgi:hypothetical protein